MGTGPAGGPPFGPLPLCISPHHNSFFSISLDFISRIINFLLENLKVTWLAWFEPSEKKVGAWKLAKNWLVMSKKSDTRKNTKMNSKVSLCQKKFLVAKINRENQKFHHFSVQMFWSFFIQDMSLKTDKIQIRFKYFLKPSSPVPRSKEVKVTEKSSLKVGKRIFTQPHKISCTENRPLS